MKKILLVVLALMLLLAGVQFATSFMLHSFIKSPKDLLSLNKEIKIINEETNSSLFYTDNAIKVGFEGNNFLITTHTKHILGIVSTQGFIKVLSEPLASFFNEDISFEIFGDKVTFKFPNIQKDTYPGATFFTKDAILQVYFDDNNINSSLKIDSFGIKQMFGHITFNQIEHEIKNILAISNKAPQTTKTTIKNISANLVVFMAELNDLKANSAANFKENLIDASFDTSIKSLKVNASPMFLKDNSINLQLNDINLDFLAQNISDAILNYTKVTMQPEKYLFNKGAKYFLKDFSFKGNDGEFKADLSFEIDENYKNIENLRQSLSLQGSLTATKPLSVILGDDIAGKDLKDIEEQGLEYGILQKQDLGYKASFKANGDDVIFNGDKSLNNIISNEFFKLLED